MPKRKEFKDNLLSIVIPAFKQEKTITRNIKNIREALDALDHPYEIIVVVDGKVDNTHKKIKDFLTKNREHRTKNIKVISYEENQGKGHAVRTGMLASRGDIIGFMDAGMDIHTEGFRMLLQHMQWYGADIIVGSKLHPVSQVRYPLYRKVLSKGYRALTQLLFGFNVKDTQVGLKFFRKEVVEKVFPRLVVKKYAFDIEILAVSYLLGFHKIYEAPVKINFKENSINKKGLAKVVFLMLWDTAAVFYRIKFLNYYKNQKR